MKRVEYAKSEAGSLKFAIFVVDDQGREEFKQRDSGDENWFPYIPSDEEHSIALELIEELERVADRGCQQLTYEGRGEFRIDWRR